MYILIKTTFHVDLYYRQMNTLSRRKTINIVQVPNMKCSHISVSRWRGYSEMNKIKRRYEKMKAVKLIPEGFILIFILFLNLFSTTNR